MDERELVVKLIATWENQIAELQKQKPSEFRNWLIGLCQKLVVKYKLALKKLNQT